jgi:hypothetical protein
MKNKISNLGLILGLFLVIAGQTAMAQNTSDYVFVETNAPNHEVLMQQYQGNPFVYFNDNSKPALYVYDQMLGGRLVNNLFVYVETQPGALLFQSGTITAENIDEHADYLNAWSDNVFGTIIIHSADVFTGSAGAILKSKLETLTGCAVEMSTSQQPFSF